MNERREDQRTIEIQERADADATETKVEAVASAMTSIEVPDWVVEIAARAYFEDMCSLDRWNDPMDEKEREDWRDGARKIITAALGAWVVQVGYQETITVQDDGVFADIERKLWHWIPGKMIPESTADTFREPIYALRQEKPE